MAKWIIIRFHRKRPGVDPDMVSWVVFEEQGGSGEVMHGSLDETVEYSTGCRVIVLVPGIDVLLTTASVPTKNRKQLMTAVPFVLEDQLVDDVEDLHFAIGNIGADGEVTCAVVARKRMDGWVERLSQFNIQADMFIPDILALPGQDQDESWALCREDDNVLVRTGPQAGFVTDFDNIEISLQIALQEVGEGRPARLNILNCDGEDRPLPDLSGLEVPVAVEHCDGNILARMAAGLDRQNALDLLQGDYSRREQLGKVWRPWRMAAGMLLGIILLKLGMFGYDHYRLKRQSLALKEQIEQVYLTTFPDAKKVVNPRVQMERRLQGLRGKTEQGGVGFLGMLASTSKVLKETSDLKLRSIRYKKGKFSIDLSIKDLQALDKLKQNLVAQGGVEVEIVSANARNNKVESRLQLQGLGS